MTVILVLVLLLDVVLRDRLSEMRAVAGMLSWRPMVPRVHVTPVGGAPGRPSPTRVEPLNLTTANMKHDHERSTGHDCR